MRIAAAVVLSIVWCAVAGVTVGNVIPAEESRPTRIPCLIKCAPSGTYDLPHLHNCEQFYRCTDGIALEMRCPGWDTFDHVTLECRSYYEARCLLEGPTVGVADANNDAMLIKEY